MILAAQDIRRRRRMIDPFFERTVAHGLTFGLGPCGYDIRVAEMLRIDVGEFKLASSMEHFDIPLDIRMAIRDKSTLARRGLMVQNTVAEPGWRGYLTLELTNQSRDWIVLHPGTPIAQAEFGLLTADTDQPYKGRYQDQPPGVNPPTEAKEGQ